MANTQTDAEKRAAEAQRQAELSSARSEKAGCESQKADKEALVKANKEKIERLKVVKTNLETQKQNAEDGHMVLKAYAESDGTYGDWLGTMCDKTKGNLNDTIVPEYQSYIDRIDEALDAVCDEITRLQNKNLQLNGDILRLASLINSLINKIRNLCN